MAVTTTRAAWVGAALVISSTMMGACGQVEEPQLVPTPSSSPVQEVRAELEGAYQDITRAEKQGCCSCALEHARQAATTFPDRSGTHAVLARLEYQHHAIDEARATAERALRAPMQEPAGRAQAHYLLARYATDHQDWDGAEEHLTHALAAHPQAQWNATRVRELRQKVHTLREMDTWDTYETAHIVFHYPPDSTRAANMAPYVRTYARRREKAYVRIAELTGVSLERKIHFYMYNSKAHGRQLMGRDLGFAEPQGYRVHEHPDQTSGHEIAHVLTSQWGPRCMRSAMIGEGVAVYLNQVTKRQRANSLRQALQQPIPTLADLDRNFWNYDTGYTLAGDFVGMVVRDHGWDKFRELWIALTREPFADAVQTAYGITVAELDATWQRRVRKLKQNLLD